MLRETWSPIGTRAVVFTEGKVMRGIPERICLETQKI
jgi:hypothetical protein